MVHRRGLGAASASSVLFAILLLSSLSLYAASQERAVLYAQADSADSLADTATALAGAGAANILLGAQSLLGSRVYYCANASATVGREVQSLSETQLTPAITVSVDAGVSAAGTRKDNLTMLSPFNGSVEGELGISLTVDEVGRAGDSVSLSKVEAHVVHLPVMLASEAGACTQAVGEMMSRIPLEIPSNCTGSAVAPLVDDAVSGLGSSGFESGVWFTIARTAPCAIDFLVSVSQDNVSGVGGEFTVRMQEGGSVTFGQRGR